MRLDSSVFAIDAAAWTERLVAFIRQRHGELRRSGIVVPLSGGLDSSTVLHLCARAIEPERITALLMPETSGEWEAQHVAERVARAAGAAIAIREIGPTLAALGIESQPSHARPAPPDPEVLALLRRTNRKRYLQLLERSAAPAHRSEVARINARHRVRSVMAMLVAEERNDLLVGAAHLSEAMLGLFVRYGVDDNADVMPLENLYRTQILQLAAHLGVPEAILRRSPNPEIIPGIEDKYLDILGIDSARVDLILWGIRHDLDDRHIAAQLHMAAEEVADVRRIVQLTAPKRGRVRAP